MKSFALAILCGAVSWIAGVNANVIGPFGLYTKSTDPNWNMRYISVGYETGYNAIDYSHLSDPSQIPQEYINYFINSTGLNDPTSDTGNLVWGPQTYGSYMRISAFYGGIGIFDPTSPIQPINFAERELSGYTTEWSLSSEGQLLLNGASQFYGHYLQAPFWNYDALFWGFAGNHLPSNTSKVTLWKYP